MTIAGKINALVISIAVAAGCILTATVLLLGYSSAREQIIKQSANLVQSQPQLQVAIYLKDFNELRATLQDILQSSPAIVYAIARDQTGLELNRAEQADMQEYESTAFADIRGNTSVVETSLTPRRGSFSGGTAGALNLPGSELVWDLTVPVLSVVNPLDENLDREMLGAALASARSASSLHVVGYVQIGISRSQLLKGLVPTVLVVMGVAMAFILLCSVFSRHMARRITAPFAVIKRMADDISSGAAVQTRGLESSGEFKEVVALLNTIIAGLNTYKTRMDVDHQLLSMKVEERTSQLSKRNEELSEAVKQVTETKDRLRKLAYYDSLTGLPNRRLFTEQLDLLLRLGRRNKEMLALLFLDLDNFKRINDSLGHSSGDLLLREVAKRLARCVRNSDVIAHYVEPGSQIDVSRLGGDEFTVVLNQLDSIDSAGMVAQRLLDTLTQPITIEGHDLVVTPSIGIAVAQADGTETVEGLLKAADTAMYHAKSSGKNKFMFYSSDMDAAGVERLKLENELRKALENKGLALHYQVQVDTLTGTVTGAEALMRWPHDELGMVPPFKFIPLAEEMGLIGAVGEWGLEEACRQMVELQSLGLDLPKVSVNVSALQFTRSFIRHVSETLATTGLRPRRLQLELTEGIMMDNKEDIVRALNDLKEQGVQLSIDDFGTGYSSLSYLSRFPLDELKIDRSFVIDFDKSQNDASLVTAIIAMARSMRLHLVAEGVETREQYHFLRNNGASIIQGYLFSKPVPFEELKALLAPGYFKEQIDELNAR